MDKNTLIQQIQQNMYRTDDGLTQEAFLFISTITPLINVDLLVKDQNKRILLSWRDDERCGTGWHIPGGIIHHKETIAERLQKTALREFGCEVNYSSAPIKLTEQLLNKEERNHFISLLYECSLTDEFDIDKANEALKETTPGYLRWFNYNPGLVYSQYGYFEYIGKLFDKYKKESIEK